jgi:hypothetical protein
MFFLISPYKVKPLKPDENSAFVGLFPKDDHLPVFKNLAGPKKLDLTNFNFFTEFQLNSTDFYQNSTDFLKISHHQIHQILMNFNKFSRFFKPATALPLPVAESRMKIPFTTSPGTRPQ